MKGGMSHSLCVSEKIIIKVKTDASLNYYLVVLTSSIPLYGLDCSLRGKAVTSPTCGS